jgi:hypothetical protein
MVAVKEFNLPNTGPAYLYISQPPYNHRHAFLKTPQQLSRSQKAQAYSRDRLRQRMRQRTLPRRVARSAPNEATASETRGFDSERAYESFATFLMHNTPSLLSCNTERIMAKVLGSCFSEDCCLLTMQVTDAE